MKLFIFSTCNRNSDSNSNKIQSCRIRIHSTSMKCSYSVEGADSWLAAAVLDDHGIKGEEELQATYNRTLHISFNVMVVYN